MSEQDKAFHQSFKPSWAPDGTLVHVGSEPSAAPNVSLLDAGKSIVSDSKDIHLLQLKSGSAQTAPAPGMMKKQRQLSHIEMESGVARARIASDFTFEEFALLVQSDDPASTQERQMWQLAAVLFDEREVNAEDSDVERRRKRDFEAFWKDVVTPAAIRHAESASSVEEKAIIQLSSHDVWKATETLVDGKDFRLATLISQIGATTSVHKNIADQIDEWRKTDVLSEISPAIRTLYELLAGNTSVSDGKGGIGLENKAETFNISTRFGLDWKRAFGLRLWYGINPEESLLSAIRMYWDDIASNRAGVNPIPWFVEQKVNTGWHDAKAQGRQDILWGLLQIYAAIREARSDAGSIAATLKLGDIISAQNLTGNPMDARLSFQLYHLLSARQIADFDEVEREHKTDVLATDYVFQLASSSANLCDAVFAALHLNGAEARRTAVKELLNLHAGVVGADGQSCEVFRTLTEELRIPIDWVYTAKALHAKAVLNDESEEVRCLLRAGRLEQAHNTLKTRVAPRAIIEEDLETLQQLLHEFIAAGAEALQAWQLGGAVYMDFAQVMLDIRRRGRLDYEVDGGILQKLERALPEMSGPGMGLEERVAVTEMGDRVASVSGEEFAEMKSLLVSMAGDRVLQDAVTLSEGFYARIAVGAV